MTGCDSGYRSSSQSFTALATRRLYTWPISNGLPAVCSRGDSPAQASANAWDPASTSDAPSKMASELLRGSFQRSDHRLDEADRVADPHTHPMLRSSLQKL